MVKKVVNFNLGSRRLTEEEAAVVQRATELFISSLGRHRKEIGSEVFDSIRETTSQRTSSVKSKGAKVVASKAVSSKSGKVAAKTAAKTVSTGSASWTSNKIAPAIRKY
jgi:hypothetical protein